MRTTTPAIVEERHRLGAQHPPHIRLTSSSVQHFYQNGAWSISNDKIIVFDDAFVAQNVCSGIEIDNDHCRNLHELIIGSQGVALNKSLQVQVKKIEEHNAEIRNLAADIPASVRGSLTVDQFCKLKVRNDIDEAIADIDRKINAAQILDEVQKHSNFENFALPKFNVDGLNALLSRGLPELEADSVEGVRDHLANAGRNAETWVAEGLPRVAAITETTGRNDCPFCAQDLGSSPVIRHYQAYFSDSYTRLREEVAERGKALNHGFGDDVAAAYERAIARLNEARTFWSRFADMPEQTFDTAATVRALNAARDAVREMLLKKHAAPFETSTLGQEELGAIEAYEALRQEHIEAMKVFEEANAKVARIKHQTASSNLAPCKMTWRISSASKRGTTRPTLIHARNTSTLWRKNGKPNRCGTPLARL